jgi:hypothetical protein
MNAKDVDKTGMNTSSLYIPDRRLIRIYATNARGTADSEALPMARTIDITLSKYTNSKNRAEDGPL